jgi:erythromycin esterase-like protein
VDTLFAADACGAVRAAAHPLRGLADDLDPILGLVGDARFVLLGEASHGTHEFYALRAELTRRLIAEHGFTAVAVEADWPDAYRVNRFVRGTSDDSTPEEALADFERFPQWMWRNEDVVAFLDWLRGHNDALGAGEPTVGFYGLDLYSLHASVEAVLAYLDRVDPEAARRARARYGCFDQFGEDPQTYGLMTSRYRAESCEDDVVAQLVELRHRAWDAGAPDGGDDARFAAEQNARLVANAEAYYRAMFRGRTASWNLRDRHMAETLDLLTAYLERPARPARVVVWEHNSHLGDARATEHLQDGQLNVGQLVREGYGRDALLVGFTTNTGWVTAASDWGGPAERKRVRPALPDSYEALFHVTGLPRFVLPLRDGDPAAVAWLRKPRLERAIGVIYRPETERQSHYFYARLPEQFDAVLHYDETRAVQPLDRVAGWEQEDAPDTYPTAL